MTDKGKVGDLELEQDLQYQQQSWVFQRIGWAAMSLIALAALLGLTGEGWLSQAKARQPGNPLWLEYERFGRFHSSVQLRIHIDKALPSNQIRIGISRKYLEGVQIQQVTPEPDNIELSSDRLIYSFKGTTPTAVTFYVQPEQMGFSSGSVGLEGTQLLQFQQFIYP